jgi:hypothetical protein
MLRVSQDEIVSVKMERLRGFVHVGLIYRHLPCFWGRFLSFEELTTYGIELICKVKPKWTISGPSE